MEVPSAISIGWRRVRSQDTWCMAGTGRANVMGSPRASSSIMARTSAVVPSLRKVCTSLRLASPVMTWRRRYFWASAWGSSRVLMMGRLSVVSRPTSSSKKSARWVSWNGTSSVRMPGASEPTLPAPVKTWRVTRWVVAWATIRPNGTVRSTRKFSWQP